MQNLSFLVLFFLLEVWTLRSFEMIFFFFVLISHRVVHWLFILFLLISRCFVMSYLWALFGTKKISPCLVTFLSMQVGKCDFIQIFVLDCVADDFFFTTPFGLKNESLFQVSYWQHIVTYLINNDKNNSLICFRFSMPSLEYVHCFLLCRFKYLTNLGWILA